MFSWPLLKNTILSYSATLKELNFVTKLQNNVLSHLSEQSLRRAHVGRGFHPIHIRKHFRFFCAVCGREGANRTFGNRHLQNSTTILNLQKIQRRLGKIGSHFAISIGCHLSNQLARCIGVVIHSRFRSLSPFWAHVAKHP